jgi:catalase
MQNYKIKAFAIPSFLIAFSIFSVDVTYAADTSPSSDKPVTEQLVDTMTLLAHGPYKGYRANHAKGIMARGTFTPSASAAGLSKAAHLQKASTPVLVRFSDTTGAPNIPDADPKQILSVFRPMVFRLLRRRIF